MQILRETAALQIQVRDHTSHVATRWKLLKLKPNMIYNWAAFAVACHLVLFILNLERRFLTTLQSY